MKAIPYGKQSITEEDIQAVVKVLRSDYLTQGPIIDQFEEAFANYIGSRYAVAVANGTAALHLSALALGVSNGDRVITTPITFVASANCIKYCGGEIDFVDIDPETYLIDIKKVKELLEANPKGTFKGIIPVDFSGRAVNMQELRKLADIHDLWIIEDSCHAPGGYFIDSNGERQQCGNGHFADLSIFSFHPVKHIATGEGGMITTNDKGLYQKLLTLRTHGITKDPISFQNNMEIAVGLESSLPNKFPNWYMEMQELGYNYRLSDIHASLGLSQLTRAKAGLRRRQEIAKEYYKAFENCEFIINQSGFIKGHAYHLYIIEINERLDLYYYLRIKNIYTQIHYLPSHLMPYYQSMGWKKGDMPCAEMYYSRCMSLPMYPSLSHIEQDFVIKSIFEYYE